MVSIGRTYRAWVLVAAIGLAACLSLGAAPVKPASEPERPAKADHAKPDPNTGGQQSPSTLDRESLAVDREANRIAERANLIAETQRAYALLQLVLGGFGVVFTGFAAFFAWRATHWAKEATQAARASATADNASLELNREALKEQREGATDQADRLAKQIKLAEANLAEMRRATVEVNRAWVVVSGEITGDLIFDESEVSITAKIAIENIGRGPAMKVIFDWGMFGTAGDAHDKIRTNTRQRSLSPISHGGVLLPGGKQTEDVKLVMTRADFLAGCKTMAELDGDSGDSSEVTVPSVFFGAQYALPGDQFRRFSYMSYFISRNDGGDFDGSIGVYRRSEITLHDARDAGPIT